MNQANSNRQRMQRDDKRQQMAAYQAARNAYQQNPSADNKSRMDAAAHAVMNQWKRKF